MKYKMYKVINETKTTKTILCFFLIQFSFIQHFIQTMNVQRKQMVLLYLQGYQKDFYGYQKHSISIRMICMKDEKIYNWLKSFLKEYSSFSLKFFSTKEKNIMKLFSAHAAIFDKENFLWKHEKTALKSCSYFFFQFHKYLVKS